MPDTPTTAKEPSDGLKREYTRPELRELGPFADLTSALGGLPGNTDSSTGYTTAS